MQEIKVKVKLGYFIFFRSRHSRVHDRIQDRWPVKSLGCLGKLFRRKITKASNFCLV